MAEKGILYLVSTPIGNLSEVSKRQIDVLNLVDYIACENPNNSKIFLNSINVNKKLIQINAIHEDEMSNRAISLILNGQNVAFISDAGYPCISDPGSILVQKAIENDIKIEVINGSSAFLTALCASGIDSTKFTFVGFLSSKSGTLINQLKNYENRCETLIFYESSHRIQEFIKALYEVFGNRKICIARELTKIHEEYLRGNIDQFLNLTENQKRGEFVIVVEGKKSDDNGDISHLLKDVDELISLGLKTKDACEYVAKKEKVSKKTLYDSYHK